jgi:hypothetical protein
MRLHRQVSVFCVCIWQYCKVRQQPCLVLPSTPSCMASSACTRCRTVGSIAARCLRRMTVHELPTWLRLGQAVPLAVRDNSKLLGDRGSQCPAAQCILTRPHSGALANCEFLCGEPNSSRHHQFWRTVMSTFSILHMYHMNKDLWVLSAPSDFKYRDKYLQALGVNSPVRGKARSHLEHLCLAAELPFASFVFQLGHVFAQVRRYSPPT